MKMLSYLDCFRAAARFPGYHPRPVTFWTLVKWLRQFEKKDRKRILRLLDEVVYFPEAQVKQLLIQQNAALMTMLHDAGLPPENLIYVQVDDAGSSSPVMLNILRDSMGLEQRGCHLLDAKDVLGIVQRTNALGRGAVIYVDDFVGSGSQLCTARDFVAKNIGGTFSEFALAAAICEEGLARLATRGVEAYSGHLHSKVDRPLHANSPLFDRETKRRLIEICNTIDPNLGLGFLDGAVMVVLYRGPPDNVPIIFRGSADQIPYIGLFPRYADLPLPEL